MQASDPEDESVQTEINSPCIPADVVHKVTRLEISMVNFQYLGQIGLLFLLSMPDLNVSIETKFLL